MPIVVSVPKIIKCLVSVDTKLNLDAVGALDKAVALASIAPEISFIKVLPFNTVAIKSSPKLSNDQLRAKTVTFEEVLGSFHLPALQVSVPHP